MAASAAQCGLALRDTLSNWLIRTLVIQPQRGKIASCLFPIWNISINGVSYFIQPRDYFGDRILMV